MVKQMKKIITFLLFFGSLIFTTSLYTKGESWPRIWYETFGFWTITFVFFISNFIKFNKKKSKTLIKRASEEEKIRVYADKINTKTRSKHK